MRKLALLCTASALAMAAWVWAQPGGESGGGRMGGPGQGPGQGPGGGMMNLESNWAAICFELKVDAKALEPLRAAFQKAWDQRRELMEEGRQGGLDRVAMREKMGPVQEGLTKAMQQYLTKEQLGRLEELHAQRRSSWQRGGGGGGGWGDGAVNRPRYRP